MLTKPSLKASAASDLVGKWLIWCVHPDKFKKNSKNKILTCTWFSLTSPKHLAQSVTRVFGRSLQRLDAYPKVIKIIHSFHEGMKVQVQDNEKTSETFPVTKRTKQGCVMAPLLFCVAFSAMLYEAFKNCDSRIMIRFRMDGGVFNICHLKSSTRVMLMLIRVLLFMDDCWRVPAEHFEQLCQSSQSLWPYHQYHENRCNRSTKTWPYASRPSHDSGW